jgi:IclR family acetate operon transcriptional repressor
MLAFMPVDQWPTQLPNHPSPRTPKTLLSLAELQQELDVTRERGFAVDDEENEEGACCIGAPIFDAAGRVTAAVSLSAPASRLSGRQIHKTGTSVMQTAAAISARLGYHKGGEQESQPR